MSSSDWSGTIRIEMAAEAEFGMSDFCAGPGTSTLWTERAGWRQLDLCDKSAQRVGLQAKRRGRSAPVDERLQGVAGCRVRGELRVVARAVDARE